MRRYHKTKSFDKEFFKEAVGTGILLILGIIGMYLYIIAFYPQR